MKRTKLAVAIAMLSATTAGMAAPVTFFGQDLNGPPRRDPNPVAAHPNSDAAQTNFLNNLMGVGTEDFENNAGGPPISLVFPGAGTATLTGGVGIQAGNDSFGRYPISGRNYYYAGSNNFNISFNSPIAAFGFYGVDIGDYGANLSLSLTDTIGNVTAMNVPLTLGVGGNLSGSVIYFGFYDTATQYTNISFRNSAGSGDNFAFDDMTIGSLQQVHPTPEPASLGLLGAGLMGLGLAYRRRRS